jgi:hypothetical protein
MAFWNLQIPNKNTVKSGDCASSSVVIGHKISELDASSICLSFPWSALAPYLRFLFAAPVLCQQDNIARK